MKKLLAMLLACVVFVTPIYAVAQENYTQCGCVISVNGEITDRTSVIFNNTHYVPLRMMFEKMGAHIFYKSSEHQILALSRNGDMIRHIMGENIVTVNEEQKVFVNPSIIVENTTYIPLDMFATLFWTEQVACEDGQLIIQKEFVENGYHKVIDDVLSVSGNDDFYPEYFNRYISYHAAMPAYSMQDVIFRVNVGLDSPFYQNIKTITYPHELLVLVNKYNKLPDNFQQYNLIPMAREYTNGGGHLLADVAYEKYTQMADAAKSEGLSMRVVSAYRTESYQAGLYNNKLRATGRVNADNYSARPGHSEHQTGLAVDINSTRGSFEYTAEFKWLKQHAHEYGFILRYPKGKEWITGYAYEPWHYRYVGVDVATVIYQEDITY